MIDTKYEHAIVDDKKSQKIADWVFEAMTRYLDEIDRLSKENATIKEHIRELKKMLSSDGEYSICRSDHEPISIIESVFVGDVLEKLSVDIGEGYVAPTGGVE